jgi:hypothetical protein
MKMLKLFTSFFIIAATIRSSEVRDIHSRKGYTYRALCASFDLVDRNPWIDVDKFILSSYQCGSDWDVIDSGILRQIEEYKQKVKEERESKDNEIRLQAIKHDQVGFTIQ